MGRSNFDKLMKRYLKNQVSEEERIKIEAWLESIKSEDNTDYQLDEEQEEKIFRAIASRTTQRSSQHIWFTSLKIAASLLLIALAGVAIVKLVTQNNTDSSVATRKTILPDGTLVWLRGESTVAFNTIDSANHRTRSCKLQGEALFEVAKDASAPFIIQCGELRVRVVGTSFNIRMNNDSTVISVLTGKVNVSSRNGTELADMVRDQQLVYSKGVITKNELTDNQSMVLTASTEYKMDFRNESLEKIAARLSEKFNRHIIVPETQTARCRITADLTDRSLDSSLQMLREIIDITVADNGKELFIRGPGCK